MCYSKGVSHHHLCLAETQRQAEEWESFNLILFIYLWLCWVLVSVRGLSLLAVSGGHYSSRCAGLSLSRPLFVVEHRLQTRRLSSCGSRAELLRGMWDLPRPGLEPVSPALAGRLSTTAPPGKPINFFLNLKTRTVQHFVLLEAMRRRVVLR